MIEQCRNPTVASPSRGVFPLLRFSPWCRCVSYDVLLLLMVPGIKYAFGVQVGCSAPGSQWRFSTDATTAECIPSAYALPAAIGIDYGVRQLASHEFESISSVNRRHRRHACTPGLGHWAGRGVARLHPTPRSVGPGRPCAVCKCDIYSHIRHLKDCVAAPTTHRHMRIYFCPVLPMTLPSCESTAMYIRMYDISKTA